VLFLFSMVCEETVASRGTDTARVYWELLGEVLLSVKVILMRYGFYLADSLLGAKVNFLLSALKSVN
jgi:hypothetical protein